MPSTTRSDGARPGGHGRAGYHHGALRTALLEGAREMLVERGPDGFSLNALARRVGVSTAAPYRHFADRDALLCALADEGYVAFGAALDAAVHASSGPRDRLRRLGIAYLRYAAENPAVFAIMFTARLGGRVRSVRRRSGRSSRP
ncbi:TetR/AcrR family transcriptional regulator [Cellulomonas sp. JZ18]|uniref:TetR/AcrR family transcriptional regulator n=1 Tax=Cellulomonas sp. JZ18 TaxID=2654191 RepID=UPI001E63272C|nr:TetR/AcrR family transcriptional regulator [Cellulomonas sp. JZ18]